MTDSTIPENLEGEEFADESSNTSTIYTDYYYDIFFENIRNFDICAWWVQAYPIIEQIAAVTGAITGVAAITSASLAFTKWMRNKLQEKENEDEYTWVKFILSKEEWSVSALSGKLDLSEDEAKRMLKGFGYKWNPQKMLYESTENTQKLRNIDKYKRDWI